MSSEAPAARAAAPPPAAASAAPKTEETSIATAPSAAEQAKINRLNEQCYLMDNWRKYALARTKTGKGYGKRFTCVDGSPSDLVQALTSQKGKEAFLELTSDQAALLVPKIKLFRVPMDPTTSKPTGQPGQEIAFKTHYDEKTIESLTTNAKQRGDAVGLKELTYELEQGGDTETGSQMMKVTITFVAESIGALAEKGPSGASALDLVIHPRKWQPNKGAGASVPSSNYFAVKVVYGWAVPQGEHQHLPTSLVKALATSVQTLVCNLESHKLSFNENGSVELEAVYNGYAEAKMAEMERNILYSSPERTKKLAAAKQKNRDVTAAATAADKAASEADKKLTAAEKEAGWFGDTDDATQDTAAEKKAEAEEAKEKQDTAAANLADMEGMDKQIKYARLLEDLVKKNKVKSFEVDAKAISTRRPIKKTAGEIKDMSPEQKEMYQAKMADHAAETASLEDTTPVKDGSTTSLEQTATAIKGAQAATTAAEKEKDPDDKKEAKADAAEAVEEARGGSTTGTSSGMVTINYMYWGDILETAMANAYNKKTLRTRHLIGPINFRDPQTAKWYTLNLADIPIALPLFQQWWVDTVLSPQLDVYTIKDFIRDSVMQLIVAALGDDCFPGAGKTTTDPPKLSISVLSAPALQSGEDRIASKDRINPITDDVKPLPTSDILPSAAYSGARDHVEYLFVYCSAWSSRNLAGNRAADLARGIYHLSVGQDRGPIKKINFEKDDDEFLNTMNALESQGIGSLAAAYDADVTMMGNTLLAPGNYVYIAPTALGVDESFAEALGLGGYYTVARMNGKIDSTGWTVDAKCMPLFHSSRERASKGRSGSQPAPTSTVLTPESAGNNPEAKPPTA